MTLFKKKGDPAPVATGVKEYAPLDKQLYDIEADNLADIVGKPVEVYPTKSAVMFTDYADVLLAINFGGLEATAVADDTADVLNADNIEFEDDEFVSTTGTKYDDDLVPVPQDDEIPAEQETVTSLADDLLSENAEKGISSDTNQSSPSVNGINNTEEGESMPNVDKLVENEMADYTDTNVSDDDLSFDEAEAVEDTEKVEDEGSEAPAEDSGADEAVVSDEDSSPDDEETGEDNVSDADGEEEPVDTEELVEEATDTDVAETDTADAPEEPAQGKRLVIPNDKPKNAGVIKVEGSAETEPDAETEGGEADKATENVPEFYTNNTQLVLLLRKMGILDVMEQLANSDDINEAELLKATSNIRKLNTAYGDAEALAVTYLESKGIDFQKLVGKNCLKYKAEQILFIGEKVGQKFEPIDAILNPEFSIAQMQCICELEAKGNINTLAFCKPSFSPSTMRQLADVYQTGCDMSPFMEFAVLTWHGVSLIQSAILTGLTSLGEYKTAEGALNENALFSKLKDLNEVSDKNTGSLGADGLTYVL